MLPCCCGHNHEENSPCSDEDCPCAQWHWYDHKHWNPEHREKKMHTFNLKSGGSINYNPDRSGHVHITNKNGDSLVMPCEELIDFVAMLVRDEHIDAVEDADNAEVWIAGLEKLSSRQILGLRE